ncbi:MAG: hypothetical protein ACLSHC_15005 [Bilophila wadsworthia]
MRESGLGPQRGPEGRFNPQRPRIRHLSSRNFTASLLVQITDMPSPSSFAASSGV